VRALKRSISSPASGECRAAEQSIAGVRLVPGCLLQRVEFATQRGIAAQRLAGGVAGLPR
jgi:hypothetical protein